MLIFFFYDFRVKYYTGMFMSGIVRFTYRIPHQTDTHTHTLGCGEITSVSHPNNH